MHRQQEAGRNQRQPQHAQKKNHRAATIPAAFKTLFFVTMLLLGVSVTVKNVRHSIAILPSINHDFGNHLDDILSALDVRKSMPGLNASDAIHQILSAPPPPQSVPGDTFLDDTNQELSLDSANQTTSIPPPRTLSLLSTVPGNNNMVVSLISMGRLRDTFLVEKCIRSIRRKGLFSGTILVFTDETGYERYQKSVLPWDNRTKIIRGRDEDLHPKASSKGTPIKYAQETMIFKRFKTHHSKYIAEDPTLAASTRYVLYIDVDNIVGDKLDSFLKAYSKDITNKYQQAFDKHQMWKQNITATRDDVRSLGGITDHDGFGFIAMFRDKHLRGKMHSGIILYDLEFEDKCVNAWRNEMDTSIDSSDQTLFRQVLENFDRYQCTVFSLPGHYMTFANRKLMTSAMQAQRNIRKKKTPPKFPTFVHVTNFRVRQLSNATIHDDFVRYILQLKDNETLTEDIMWEDAVPSDSRLAVK